MPPLPYALALAPRAESLPAPKNFFAITSFTQRLPPLWDRTIFGQVFVRGGMTKFSKWKVPPTGGSSAPKQTVGELGTTRHCCAPRRRIARSFEMRCTVPVPMPRDLATIPLMVRWIACTTRSSVSPVATLTATGTAHVTYVTAERYFAQLGGPRRAPRSVRRLRRQQPRAGDRCERHLHFPAFGKIFDKRG